MCEVQGVAPKNSENIEGLAVVRAAKPFVLVAPYWGFVSVAKFHREQGKIKGLEGDFGISPDSSDEGSNVCRQL